MTRVYVALGSNVEPERHIAMAVQALRRRFGALTLSPIYRNRAIGFEGEDFLNAVTGFDSTLTVPDLKAVLDEVEQHCGRQRGAARFAPRTLDLDLLLYGDTVDAAAKLPRSEVLEYDFMLKPLTDIAAAERHPQTGRSYAEHWASFKGQGGQLLPVILPGV